MEYHIKTIYGFLLSKKLHTDKNLIERIAYFKKQTDLVSSNNTILSKLPNTTQFLYNLIRKE